VYSIRRCFRGHRVIVARQVRFFLHHQEQFFSRTERHNNTSISGPPISPGRHHPALDSLNHWITSFGLIGHAEAFPRRFYDPLKSLWLDPNVKQAGSRGNEVALPEKCVHHSLQPPANTQTQLRHRVTIQLSFRRWIAYLIRNANRTNRTSSVPALEPYASLKLTLNWVTIRWSEERTPKMDSASRM